MRPRTAALALALAALLAACGSSNMMPSAEPSGVGGDWTLVSGSGPSGPLVLVDGSPVTLSVTAGQVSGRSACNSYSGPVRTSGGRFEPGELSSTMMGCVDPAVGALETGYLGALARVTRAAVDGDALVLTGSDVTLRFHRNPPVRDLPLEGTSWVLDTTFDGRAASASSEPGGTLRFRAGGVTGRGACRDLRAGYTLDGATLRLTGVALVDDPSRDCTAEAAARDEHLVDVLHRPLTVEISGSRLTLMAGTQGFGFQGTAAS